jgi:HSP20 family molecular chaperone IbpA
MSLFPRGSFINDPQPNFPSVFRLLDEFNEISRAIDRPANTHLKSFNPKFDVKEIKDAYELHGELPGIDQKDVEIEFTDIHTLTIKGRVERSYTKGTPPAGFIEGEVAGKAIEGAGENGHHVKAVAHKATVEDAGEGNEKNVAVQAQQKKETPQEPEEKFWVSERSVGTFSRSFSFPVRVDQDNVKASMKNGILSIVVPKAKKHESKKITIH